MASIKVRLRIRMAWWWQWYALGVAVVAVLTDSQPDFDKVRAYALKATRVTVLHDEDKG
jgi:hypothetical protein